MPRSNEAGAALVVALGVLAITASIAVGLAALVRSQAQEAASGYERMALYQAAKGGINLARAVLAGDEPAWDSLDEEWALLDGQEVELPDGSLVVVRIQDASARLNVNQAAEAVLAGLPGMTPEMLDSLLDWRDTDQEPREQGAEDEFYQALDPPYQAANGPLASLDELLLVRGWTPLALYEPAERERSQLPLAELLAVRSGEWGVNGQGQPALLPTVNVNTAPAEVLAALPGSDEETAQAIIARREGEEGPFAGRDDLVTWMEAERRMIGQVSTGSAVFLVTATARWAEGPGYRTLQATVQRKSTGQGTTVVAWRELFRPLPRPEQREGEESASGSQANSGD